ncbi:bifunctional DNA primase/polymerase [Streptomyces sp. YIM 98790]|uniref:bifunctional DNA primase/polymerase n=1 Tax=Streptomyces sp. YIM 98790 TaxID=2689077 RepID=UPI001A9E4E48|nr:bifunctional DNA primase/polymerase [Streptomyces sp. YIM 98790]
MQTTERAGCRRCGERLPVGGRGRVPSYCSTRCRVAAYRARRAEEALPPELARGRRWVRRDGKRPIRADNGRSASATDPFTWTTHPRAARSEHGDGLGRVLAAGDRLVCIDLDHCLSGGRLAGWARKIVDRCPPTYTEVSPSGTGLHIWGRGEVTRGRRIRRPDGAHIEVYGAGRYIALGRRHERSPLELADLSDLVAELT